jgi:FixJ family two-component response regulator
MEYESSRGFLVTVIDDDQSVRESLPDLLRESGYEVETFSSAEEFLTSSDRVCRDPNSTASCSAVDA